MDEGGFFQRRRNPLESIHELRISEDEVEPPAVKMEEDDYWTSSAAINATT